MGTYFQISVVVIALILMGSGGSSSGVIYKLTKQS